MFIMMNAARFNVGLEGLGDAERAYQRAVAYARDRVQGAELGVKGGPKVPIIKHPDVRRMLMSMRSRIEAMRALAYVTASAQDNAHCNPDEAARQQGQAFADLMIPVVKGWSTESAIDIASLGVQVHGGMGFIEDTGASLFDSYIDPETQEIELLDNNGKKIVVYDKEGNHLRSFAIPFMSFTLTKTDQHNYWFYNNNLPSEACNYKVAHYNRIAEKSEEAYDSIDPHLAEYFFIEDEKNLVTQGNSMLYHASPADTVYRIQPGKGMEAAYILDMGKNKAKSMNSASNCASWPMSACWACQMLARAR
jgi:hypothetical protein